MIRALKYHIKTSIKNMWRHFPQTLMSATAVTITLSLIAAFMIVAVNISEITNGIASDVRIQATIDTAIEQSKISEIEAKIKQLVEVKNIVYNTKHQELDKFISATSDGEETYGQYRGDQNPLRDAFYIELRDENTNTNTRKERLKSVTEQIKKIEGIVDAQYGGQTVENLVVLLSRVRIAGYTLAIGMAILAILLIQNAIKSTIHSRQSEISIMRDVGASNGFIKVPFMLEGVYIGIIGSIIPIAALLLSYEPIYNILLSGMKVFTLVPPYPFIYIMCVSLIGAGILVGLLGSFLSVSKYLRFRR